MNAKQRRDLIRAVRDARAVLAYVSAGRSAVDHIGPYPDATARRALAQLDEALSRSDRP